MTTQHDTQSLTQKRLLTTQEAADYLGFSAQSLRQQRYLDQEPGSFGIKLHSRKVVYDVAQLDAWVDEQARRDARHNDRLRAPK